MARRRRRKRGLGQPSVAGDQAGTAAGRESDLGVAGSEQPVFTSYRELSDRPATGTDVVAIRLAQRADDLVLAEPSRPRQAQLLTSPPATFAPSPPKGAQPSAAPAAGAGKSSHNLREILAAAIALTMVGGVCYGSMRVVPSGAIGVVTCPWGESADVVAAGRHLIVPVVCGMSLYAAGDLRLDIDARGATASDGLALEEADLTIVYRIDPKDVPAVLAIDGVNSRETEAAGVQSPLEGRIRHEADRLFKRMVELVRSEDIASKRMRLAMLLHEDLQAAIDDAHQGRVRIVSVDIPVIAPDRRVAKLLAREAWENAAAAAGVDAGLRFSGGADREGFELE